MRSATLSRKPFKSFWGGVWGGCFCKNILPDYYTHHSLRAARFAPSELIHCYSEDDHHADHN